MAPQISRKRKRTDSEDKQRTYTIKHNGTPMQCIKCMSHICRATNTLSSSRHAMHTRRITASHSRHAVFNTVELLESILAELPPQKIISARLVNKHWNAVIITSPHLRRRLFLMPESKSEAWLCDRVCQNVSKWAPDVVERFGQEWADRQYYITPARLNPLLFAGESKATKGTLAQRSQICESVGLLGKPDLKKTSSIYYNMFVCMPPIKKVEFCFFYRAGERKKGMKRECADNLVRIRVENQSGVRLRDILEGFIMHAGARTREVARKYSISVGASKLWMLGAVFATNEEKELVEKASK